MAGKDAEAAGGVLGAQGGHVVRVDGDLDRGGEDEVQAHDAAPLPSFAAFSFASASARSPIM